MTRVLLCGNSLFVACLQTILEAKPTLDIQLADTNPEHIRKHIDVWKPDALVLETALMKTTAVLSILQDYPHMKLIGLDIEDHHLMVFSGSAASEPTPEQLIQIIEG